MLFKAATEEARDAAFAPGPARRGVQAGAAAGPAPVDARDLELEGMRSKIASLEHELDRLQRGWASALDEAGKQARSEAAREHVRDDERFLAALRQSLVEARRHFDARLEADCNAMAHALAARAFARLAELRQEDDDWLSRVISRRANELASGSLVVVRVAAAEFQADVLDKLRSGLPAGTRIELAPEIEPGTARLELVLGEVIVDSHAGITKLAAHLTQDAVDE